MARVMRTTGALLATGALAIGTLTGCQLFVAKAPQRTPTAIEACATGHTWELDTEAFTPVAQASMKERGLGVTVAVSGSQRLTWDEEFRMTFDTDLTFTGTVDGSDPVITQTYTAKGTSTGLAYFSGTVAIPRDWNEDLAVRTETTQDGAPVDPAFTWVPLWIDDMVGLKTTCSAEQLQLEARQGHLVWTFNRVG